MLSDKIIGWPKSSPYQKVEDLEPRAIRIYNYFDSNQKFPVYLGTFLMYFAAACLKNGFKDMKESLYPTLIPCDFCDKDEKTALRSFMHMIDAYVESSYSFTGKRSVPKISQKKDPYRVTRSLSFFASFPDSEIYYTLLHNEILADHMVRAENERRKDSFLQVLAFRNIKLIAQVFPADKEDLTDDLHQEILNWILCRLKEYSPDKGANVSTWYTKSLEMGKIEIKARIFGDESIKPYKLTQAWALKKYRRDFEERHGRAASQEEIMAGLGWGVNHFHSVLLYEQQISEQSSIEGESLFRDVAVEALNPEQTLIEKENKSTLVDRVDLLLAKAMETGDKSLMAWHYAKVDGQSKKSIAQMLNIDESQVSALVQEGKKTVTQNFSKSEIEVASHKVNALIDKLNSFTFVLDESKSALDYASEIVDDMFGDEDITDFIKKD